jgi:NAD(P) transhydrogenase subunit beta
MAPGALKAPSYVAFPPDLRRQRAFILHLLPCDISHTVSVNASRRAIYRASKNDDARTQGADMPDLAGNAVWLGGSFLLAAMLAAVLVGVSQLAMASHPADGMGDAAVSAVPHAAKGTAWRAMLVTAMLAALLAAGAGAAQEVIAATIAGAALGARLVRRRNLTRRPGLVALLGGAIGCTAVCTGFARFLASTAHADVERGELYVAVFIGALIFAASAVAWFRLRGVLDARAAVHPGAGVVNLTAFVICIWLGYGFVTEHAQRFGVAVLLAMSLLAAALGAHVTMNAAGKRPLMRCAGPQGQRAYRRCDAQPGCAGHEGFEWPDEQLQALIDDDFAQSWSLSDAKPGGLFGTASAAPSAVLHRSAYGPGWGVGEGVAWRYRGRVRVLQRRRAARRSRRAVL